MLIRLLYPAKMNWFCKTFEELSSEELYQIIRLRVDVFVVEQECAYHELDNKDQIAFHLFAVSDDTGDTIAAYSRIFKEGDYHNEAAIGRIVVHPNFRNQKLGYQLVAKSLAFIERTFQSSRIKISAQSHLKRFYESFGFKQIGDDYLEDGIQHIDMLKC